VCRPTQNIGFFALSRRTAFDSPFADLAVQPRKFTRQIEASIADIEARLPDVRFTPKADIAECVRRVRFGPTTDSRNPKTPGKIHTGLAHDFGTRGPYTVPGKALRGSKNPVSPLSQEERKCGLGCI